VRVIFLLGNKNNYRAGELFLFLSYGSTNSAGQCLYGIVFFVFYIYFLLSLVVVSVVSVVAMVGYCLGGLNCRKRSIFLMVGGVPGAAGGARVGYQLEHP